MIPQLPARRVRTLEAALHQINALRLTTILAAQKCRGRLSRICPGSVPYLSLIYRGSGSAELAGAGFEQ